jgi:hypothetical protein
MKTRELVEAFASSGGDFAVLMIGVSSLAVSLLAVALLLILKEEPQEGSSNQVLKGIRDEVSSGKTVQFWKERENYFCSFVQRRGGGVARTSSGLTLIGAFNKNREKKKEDGVCRAE